MFMHKKYIYKWAFLNIYNKKNKKYLYMCNFVESTFFYKSRKIVYNLRLKNDNKF